MDDNKNEKFQFVNIEDIEDISVKNNIEIVSTPSKVGINSLNEESHDVEENIISEDDNIDISHKKHFSFEARIIVSVIAIIILFIGACFLGLRVINHTTTENISYVENSDFTYQVCLKNATCEPENITYNANDINIIKISFKYDAKYQEKYNYNKYYRVSTVISSRDNKENNLLYLKENDLVDRINVNDNSIDLVINETVVIDYNKYKDIVKDYKNANSQLEVILYLEDNNETRRVSSLTIPLSKENFDLVKYTTVNENRIAKNVVNVWDSYSLIYTIATSFLTIISLILIYRTTRLVLRVVNNKSEYEEAVDDLLREYDNVIVIARDGYESIDDKKIYKVESFQELVDIRDRINKPIIFSVVNDVKCEFIVEDEALLYKYVLKEADFTD